MLKPIKLAVSIFFVVSLLHYSSCSKEPFTVIEKIEVRTQGSFKFVDGLTLATSSKEEYELFVLTNTDRADVYYSINNAEAIKLKGYWITVDSTANFIDFYSSSQKPSTENFRLNFGFDQTNLIDSTTSVYPNPVEDILTFKLVSETRGEIELKIMDITGAELYKSIDFVSAVTFKKEINVNNFEKGIYLLRAKYGDSKSIIKFVKS